MKPYYLALALTATILLIAPGAAADTNAPAAISELTATETLSHSGLITVNEHLTVQPGTGLPAVVTQRIPVSITDDQGNVLPSAFKILSATAGNHSLTVQTSNNGALASINFPLPSGVSVQDFALSYTLSPVMLAGPNADVFKFSAIGLDWNLPVQAATVTLNTPGTSPQDLTCYTGVSGSTTSNCRITTPNSHTNVIVTDATLQSGESLSLYAGFPQHSFSDYYNNWHIGLLIPWLISAIVLIALVIALLIWLGRRRRRGTKTTD